jgi:adenylate cyclase
MLMKKRLPLITGLILLIAGAVCYIYEPPVLRDLSRRVFDIFLEHNAAPVQSDAIAIIDIDDASLEEFGQWPWPRTRLAELASNLWKHGAAVVVFDIIFIEPDRTSPAELSKHWKTELGADVSIQGLSSNLWNFDSVFAESLQGGTSVLGCYLNLSSRHLTEFPADERSFYRGVFFEKGAADRTWLPQAESSLQPLDPLARAAAGIASINTIPDRDSIIRTTPLVFAYGPGRIYPSLALEAVRLYAGARKVGVIYDMEGAAGISHIQVFDGKIPTDANGRLTINWRSTRFPYYSAADVIRGNIPEGAVRDKILFVGTSAAGLQDIRSTPLNPELPGVEIHATAADNMLAGDILREPRWMFFANLLTLLLGGLIVMLFVVYTPALLSFLVMVLADAAVIGTSWWFLHVKNLVVHPAETIVAWGVVFTGVIAVKYWQEEHGRKKVRSMFGTMVSPNVLQYLEQNPGSFSLTGAKADATMFFSDVAGFTTISESLEPAQLAELLNRYLSPMTDIIMARGGYVDKYEGDAIMAEWGVPFPMGDHAAQACTAALEQQEKLAELRAELKAEFGHELTVRMGLNTGSVTAGNMGSANRFQYTVMGDAVNQASRFESANKCYGSLIMIGETTYQAVHELFETRLLDLIIVKGKTKPIRIYELLARAGELAAEKKQVVALYHEALTLHWERKFDEAVAKLDEALAVMKDEPSHWLRQRIIGYLETPPAEGWSGEFVNPTK